MVEPKFPRDIPPQWLLLSLLAMVGLHFGCPLGTWFASPWRHVGWAMVAAAMALTGLSALRFSRAGTGIKPFTPATTLVLAGAYRWTRNPMYVGLTAITLGVAIALGTWSPLLVPPCFFLVLATRFVPIEEAFMRQRFGAEYDDYCRRVRRWL